MSNYFNKTHEEIEFEETTCFQCGGTWFWSFHFANRYTVTPNNEDAVMIRCPYCNCEYAYVL